MVIYVYTKPSLFFLAILAKFAELFDGLVGVFTFGLVHTSTNYRIFMKLAVEEIELRGKYKYLHSREEWPRIQIWPRKK